jgi:hypothetical protein
MPEPTGAYVACDLPPEGWWCSKEKGHGDACPTRSTVPQDEALLLLPALWQAHEYLRREDAPDHNKVANALRILDQALTRWTAANPLPDDGDQFDTTHASGDDRG